jgi:hypothetical protein
MARIKIYDLPPEPKELTPEEARGIFGRARSFATASTSLSGTRYPGMSISYTNTFWRLG